jgi:hypothetical protein
MLTDGEPRSPEMSHLTGSRQVSARIKSCSIFRGKKCGALKGARQAFDIQLDSSRPSGRREFCDPIDREVG